MMNAKISGVALCATALWAPQAFPQHEHDHQIEEIIISASQNRSRAETALPVNVLTGEELSQKAAATLGDSIKTTLGVHSSSFGAGVGQPVVRGLSGNRVTVLENNLSTLDASGASQDHASTVEALLAERIEIVRGPATLLYGSGAIGGVVNVIDNRIPRQLPQALTGAVETRFSRADSGRVAVARLEGGASSLAWHLDGVFRETDDYDIPGWAIDEAALEHAEHEAGEHNEELENSRHFVANSDTEAQRLTAGASWIGDGAFAGVAVTRLENNYGLPPGAHGHTEHEEPAGAHEEAHSEFVRLDMEQERIDLVAATDLGAVFHRTELQLSSNRYEHQELEGEQTGTRFTNDGLEGRIKLHHRIGSWSGLAGVHASDRDFAAVGEEAFIPESQIGTIGIFLLETLDQNNFTHEFGARFEQPRIDTTNACDYEETTWSASAASIWHYREDANLSLSLSRAQRTPSVEELYSNVDGGSCTARQDPETFIVHGATGRFELGNPGLSVETAQNLELGWHKHLGPVQAEVNLFYNRFDDFIYLSDVGEHEEVIVSRYLQEDATFKGIEGQVLLPLDLGGHHLDLTLFGDLVRGELNDGQPLPRIPPARIGFEMAYASQDHWSVRLRTTAVGEQDEVAPEESTTDGYVRVDAHWDYHLPVGNEEVVLFLKGENLTDEEIRDHSSLLKNYAPERGRSFQVGLRYSF
ncbi:TonB-dependent receptor [Gilvimarinus sp. F26214L]|uniref:TonB-dependent receptor n=1 Tax=Gilvimarinus sp. DZF01 TaxID=3461371 RepID=UPI0040455B21